MPKLVLGTRNRVANMWLSSLLMEGGLKLTTKHVMNKMEGWSRRLKGTPPTHDVGNQSTRRVVLAVMFVTSLQSYPLVTT